MNSKRTIDPISAAGFFSRHRVPFGGILVLLVLSLAAGHPDSAFANPLPQLTQNRVGVLERVSVASDGTEANGGSSGAVVSADGRFVAFTSEASNLVPGDTNGFPDVFLRDTCRGPSASVGCTPSTARVSVANDGSQTTFDAPYSGSFDPSYYYSQDLVVVVTCNPAGAYDANVALVCLRLGSSVNSISADGRFLVFTSDASNLANGFQNVFVRDTCIGAPAGCTLSTFPVSVTSDGIEGNNDSVGGLVSADGRFVAFTSRASNLRADDTVNYFNDVFVRDTCFGASAGCTPSTFRVSLANDGTQNNGASYVGAVSADGRFVSFSSGASNLVVNDTNGVWDVFLRDTCAGAPVGCTPSTFRASVASDGTQGNGGSYGGSVSADGRFVAFHSDASNLVADDTNGVRDVFVRDTCAGTPADCMPSTVRVSVASDGVQANQTSSDSAITADGRFVVFMSLADNLVAGDTNGYADIFLASTGR